MMLPGALAVQFSHSNQQDLPQYQHHSAHGLLNHLHTHQVTHIRCEQTLNSSETRYKPRVTSY